MSSYYEREGNDVERPTAPHVAVTLVLDVSVSMNKRTPNGTCIELLNEGVNHLIAGLSSDSDCRDVVDLSIITFGERATPYQPFSPIGMIQEVGFPANEGDTLVTEAIRLANEKLRSRTREYTVKPYTPWMIIMTDGDFRDDVTQVGKDLKDRVSEGKLQTMCLGIGDEYNATQLTQLSDHAYALANYDFKAFMGWLFKALAIVSKSKQGDEVDFGVPQGIIPMRMKT